MEPQARTEPAAPFACTYSPNLPELIHQLGCSVVLTTYQAGKLVFFSATSEDDLVQLPRNLAAPMGMGQDGERLAVACRDHVQVFRRSALLAAKQPGKEGKYDSLYVPTAAYFTGPLALHDMGWDGQGRLVAVNTAFSCLSYIGDQQHFDPFWKPSFISAFEPGDRCHLNGLAWDGRRPAYVTCLDRSDEPGSWRKERDKPKGLLIDVASGEPVLEQLHFPHSPRLYDDGLYLLGSGNGELLKVDLGARKATVICQLQGFARGLARHGSFLFVGLSKIRQKSSTFKDLPIAKRSPMAGFQVIDLRSGTVVAWLRYESSVDEIYDVQLLPGLRRPGILAPGGEEARSVILSSHAGYWAKRGPEAETAPGQAPTSEAS
jgi:uncharacterized protein (TIGR03032 family)